MFAHIYKARAATGFKFSLIVSKSSSICAEEVIETIGFDSKGAAKAHAIKIGAKAWNY